MGATGKHSSQTHRTLSISLAFLLLLSAPALHAEDPAMSTSSAASASAQTPIVAIVKAETASEPKADFVVQTVLDATVDGADDSSAFDLDRAESKDPGGVAPKLEIIKQIRRLNSDGSYTVGYEADDGTFKIESRDVLGNVKGTYGYVDINGEIKRVSYTAGTNSTTSRMVSAKSPDEARNRTGAAASSTTRRPAALAYLTSASAQTSPTRATVIQAIPKKSRPAQLAGSSSERSSYNQHHHPHHHFASTRQPQQSNELVQGATRKVGGEPTTTVVYATSAPTNRPQAPVSNGASTGGINLINIRPTPLPGSYKTSEQLMRPDKLEITDHVSKVQISSNRDTSTAKPVTELVDEKDAAPSASSEEDKRSTRGSFPAPRPTQSDASSVHNDDGDEAVSAQQQVIYSQSAGDDASPAVPGTSRPVFSVTPTTRIPSAVLAARSRVAQLQNAINQQQLAKQQQAERVYAKTPRRRPESREDMAAEQLTAAQPSSETQYVAAQRPQASVQAAGSGSGDEDEKRVYRRPVAQYAQNVPQAYRTREFVRQSPPPSNEYSEYTAGPRQFRIPIPQAYPAQPLLARHVYAEPQHQQQQQQQQQLIEEGGADQQQYLRETTVMSARPAAAASTTDPEYPGYRQRGGGRQYLPYGPQQPHQHSQRPLEPEYDPYGPALHHQPHHQQHQQLLQNPYNPYANRAPLPSQQFQHPDRPLTARDFERLLNLLVIRHQQLQRYQSHNPYAQPHLHAIPPYNNNNQFGYQPQPQIPRPPLYNPYDPRLSGLIRPPLYGEFSDQDAAYQPPTNNPAGGAGNGGAQVAARPPPPPLKRPVYYERPEYSEASQPIAVHQQQQQQQQLQLQQQPELQGGGISGEYLPADIREELLYRMLLLAMQPQAQQPIQPQDVGGLEQQADGLRPEYAALGTTTTTTKPLSAAAALTAKFRKPVRSVQILGEE